MRKTCCSIRTLTVLLITTIFLGLTGPTVDAALTARQVKRVHHAAIIHKKNIDNLMAFRHVVATGVGLGTGGEAVIRVFLAKKNRLIPARIEDVRVYKEISGRLVALRGPTCEASGDFTCTNFERWPLPVPIGVSLGHPAVTAGTLGARVTDGNDVFILSNNHVLADVNQARIGDDILQPGSLDGGLTPDDAIATLTDFEPVDFTGINTMDAAIAVSTTGQLGFSTSTGEYGSLNGYGVPSSTLHPAYGVPDLIGDENTALLLGTPVRKMAARPA